MRKKILTGTEVQQTVRIPKSIHDWITERAEKAKRSFNSEIVLLLAEIKEQKDDDAGVK